MLLSYGNFCASFYGERQTCFLHNHQLLVLHIFKQVAPPVYHYANNNCELSMQEARDFKKLVLSDTSKGLVHVFFAQRATSKVTRFQQAAPIVTFFPPLRFINFK